MTRPPSSSYILTGGIQHFSILLNIASPSRTAVPLRSFHLPPPGLDRITSSPKNRAELTQVDFNSQVVMRQLLLALRQALTDRSAHVGNGDILVLCRRGGSGRAGGSGGSCGRGAGTRGAGVLLDVFLLVSACILRRHGR